MNTLASSGRARDSTGLMHCLYPPTTGKHHLGSAAVLAILVSAGVALTAAVLGTPQLIRYLTAHGVGQPIHDALTHHAHKSGTPTMGGVILPVVVAAGYFAGLLVEQRRPTVTGVLVVCCIAAGAAVGAVDD